MRLTNVAQMDLADGRVFSYRVRAAAEPGAELPISFDQAMHAGRGQRPGSWMALAFRLAAEVTREELSAAWDLVVARHGTLQSVFSLDGAGELALHAVEVAPGSWQEHEVPVNQLTREVLRDLFDEQCAPLERPSHCLCVIEPPSGAADERWEVVIGSDHSHVDMWSLVVLARDLLEILQDQRLHLTDVGARLPEARPFSAHTAQLAAMPTAPTWVADRWAAILAAGGGLMPTFPLPLGQLEPRPVEVVEVRDVLDAEETDRLTVVAQTQGVRLLGLGLSVLTEVTARVSGQPLRAIFPVHSRHEPGWHDSVGWFITNAVLECTDPDPVACMVAVDEATGLGSWPLRPLMEPYGGMPFGPGSFAISWLDSRRLPVPKAQADHLRYVSARIRTDGVMIWFLVNKSGLHLRCRYPDTPEARLNVGGWLDAVQAGIRELTALDLTA